MSVKPDDTVWDAVVVAVELVERVGGCVALALLVAEDDAAAMLWAIDEGVLDEQDAVGLPVRDAVIEPVPPN